MIKRFLVFRYDTYYPGGGWSDLEGHFSTKEEAFEFARKLKRSGGVEVIDLETGEDLWRYDND